MVGLEPSIGWLHEFTGSQTRESAVYDLMEPFRWLGDLATIQAFESGVLDLKDFYFTGDDYRYRFEEDAKRRFLDMFKEQFSSGVLCKGRTLKWDTIIQEKANQLGRYLTGKSNTLDFAEPAPVFKKTENRAIRERILSLTQSEARKLGIGKSTLHYMRKSGGDSLPFNIYRPIRSRLGV